MTGNVALIFNNTELQQDMNPHLIQALLFPKQHKSDKKLKATI